MLGPLTNERSDTLIHWYNQCIDTINANASNYKESKWGLFLPVEAPSSFRGPHLHQLLLPYHCALVSNWTRKRKINHSAQDRWPTQSHGRHVLCWNPRMHTSASGISPSYLQNSAASSRPGIITGETVYSCGKQSSPGWSCKGHLVTHHSCPGCSWRMRAERSATYVSTITVNKCTASASTPGKLYI